MNLDLNTSNQTLQHSKNSTATPVSPPPDLPPAASGSTTLEPSTSVTAAGDRQLQHDGTLGPQIAWHNVALGHPIRRYVWG